MILQYLGGMTISPLLVEAKEDNSENQMKKIFTQKEKICEFQDNICKKVAKIGKIYTDTVEK